MNAFPNAAMTSSGPSPPAIPVASPATVTTRSGFILRTKPTTTITTPINENMELWIAEIHKPLARSRNFGIGGGRYKVTGNTAGWRAHSLSPMIERTAPRRELVMLVLNSDDVSRLLDMDSCIEGV